MYVSVCLRLDSYMYKPEFYVYNIGDFILYFSENAPRVFYKHHLINSVRENKHSFLWKSYETQKFYVCVCVCVCVCVWENCWIALTF